MSIAKRLEYTYEPIDFEIPLPGVADAAVDSHGNIFATSSQSPIVVFDKTGRKLYGWGKGVIVGAHGLYIDASDNVYVADSGDHTVKKFGPGPEHPLLLTLGNPGVPSDTGAIRGNFKTIKRGAGPFYSPSKVTASPKGEIFVSDGYGNSRVHRFSPSGELLASWGEPGVEPGQFNIVHGVGVDEHDRVYVCDRENNRVQVFDVNGKLLSIWENIMRPDGLCVFEGHVYVAELGHIFYVDNVLYEPYENMPWSRVRVFNLDGEEVACFGGSDPTIPGNMWAAHSMNVDAEGSIYVADAGWPTNEQPLPPNLHNALQKFRRIA